MVRFLLGLSLFFFFSCQNDQREQVALYNDSLEESNPKPDVIFAPHDDAIYAESPIEFPLSEIEYYESGEVRAEFYYLSDWEEYAYTYYYKNGNLKQTGNQGGAGGCGTAIDTSRFYNIKGYLEKQTVYANWLVEDAGCHETRMVMSNLEYYPSGQVKSSTQIESCYECDECPCGIWRTYDLKGNLVMTESFGDCYDSVLECLD